MDSFTWRSRHPLDLAASLARYARWGGDPVNRFADGCFRRAIRTADGPLAYRARQLEDGAVAVEVDDGGHAEAARADLAFRLSETLPHAAAADLAAADPVLGPMFGRRTGYRPALTPDPFEMLVTSVTAQQVNLTWAATTRRRLVLAFGEPLGFGRQELWLFPTPESLAAAEPAALRELQFTWSKARFIVGIARAAADGYLAGLAEMDDAAAAAHLTGLHGVGRWTADWVLARSLGRPAVVAAGDLGVRKAVGLCYLGLDRKATEVEVRRAAAQWGDAANWAAHVLLEELT